MALLCIKSSVGKVSKARKNCKAFVLNYNNTEFAKISNKWILCILDSSYDICVSSSKKRCTSAQLEGHKNVDENQCRILCNTNNKCKFIRYVPHPHNYCGLFEFCNFELINDTQTNGSIFAKESCPGKTN